MAKLVEDHSCAGVRLSGPPTCARCARVPQAAGLLGRVVGLLLHRGRRLVALVVRVLHKLRFGEEGNTLRASTARARLQCSAPTARCTGPRLRTTPRAQPRTCGTVSPPSPPLRRDVRLLSEAPSFLKEEPTAPVADCTCTGRHASKESRAGGGRR